MASLTAFVPAFASGSGGNLLHLHRKLDSVRHLGIHKLHSALYLLRGLVQPNWQRSSSRSTKSTKGTRKAAKEGIIITGGVLRLQAHIKKCEVGAFWHLFRSPTRPAGIFAAKAFALLTGGGGWELRIWVENACLSPGRWTRRPLMAAAGLRGIHPNLGTGGREGGEGWA